MRLGAGESRSESESESECSVSGSHALSHDERTVNHDTDSSTDTSTTKRRNTQSRLRRRSRQLRTNRQEDVLPSSGRFLQATPVAPVIRRTRPATYAVGVTYLLVDSEHVPDPFAGQTYPVRRRLMSVLPTQYSLIRARLCRFTDELLWNFERRWPAMQTERQLAQWCLQEDTFVVRVVQQLRDALIALLTSPRLPNPVWLSMLASPDDRPRYVSSFLRSFHQLGKFRQNDLLATVLTAVLSENLSWLHTVSPELHGRAAFTEHLPQCPYAFENSVVTCALRSLYGAECACALYPDEVKENRDSDLRGVRRLTRTVLVGSQEAHCLHFLCVISYFVRSPLLMLSENPFLSRHAESTDLERIRSPVSRPRTVLSSQRNLDRLLQMAPSSPQSDSLALTVASSLGSSVTSNYGLSGLSGPTSPSSVAAQPATQPLPRGAKQSSTGADALLDSSEFSSGLVDTAAASAAANADDSLVARQRIRDLRQRLQSETLLTQLQAVGFPGRHRIEELTRACTSRTPQLSDAGVSVTGMLFGGYSRAGYVSDLVTLAMAPPQQAPTAPSPGSQLPSLGLRGPTLHVRDLLSRDLRLWANRPFLPSHTPDLTTAVLADVDAGRCVLVSQAPGMPAARFASTRTIHSSRLLRELVSGVVGLLDASADDQLVLMYIEDRLRNLMRRASLLHALALELRATSRSSQTRTGDPLFASEEFRARLATTVGVHIDDMILLRSVVRFFDRTLLC